jgi:hypothetical protein
MISVIPNWFDSKPHVDYLADKEWVEPNNDGPLLLADELSASQHLYEMMRFHDVFAQADQHFGVTHWRYEAQDKKIAHLKTNETRLPLGPHVDVPTIPEGAPNPENFNTVLVYLNDGYEGGELIVGDDEWKFDAGTLVLLPGDVLHEVGKCRGDRLVAVTHLWVK